MASAGKVGRKRGAAGVQNFDPPVDDFKLHETISGESISAEKDGFGFSFI